MEQELHVFMINDQELETWEIKVDNFLSQNASVADLFTETSTILTGNTWK